MIQTLLVRGLGIGLACALLTALADTCFMLMPRTYFPAAYPLMTLAANAPLWLCVCAMASLALWLRIRNKPGCRQPEASSWIMCCIIPFALIYSYMGLQAFENYKKPPFDNHLAALWIAAVVFFAIRSCRKARGTGILPAFIPEITAIIALNLFCANLLKIPRIDDYGSRLLSGLAAPETLATAKQLYYWAVYACGVTIILTLYRIGVAVRSRWRPRTARQLLLLAAGTCAAMLLVATLQQRIFFRSYSPGTAPAASTPPPAVPRVILIVLDTLRADRMSVYGHPAPTTPNLEAFARDALVFDNCIASSSWTYPSHASLFTGLYPVEHGSHNTPGGQKLAYKFTNLAPLNPEFTTLAEIFQASGYLTAGIVSNYTLLHPGLKFNRGFQLYDSTKGMGSMHEYPFKPLLPMLCYLTNISPKYNLFYRVAEDINALVFRALDSIAASPHFLFINYMDPHNPYCPPRPYGAGFIDTASPQLRRLQATFPVPLLRLSYEEWISFLLSQYDGDIAYLDHHLGRLFERLKAQGLYKDSLIVVTSDHGDLFNEHGLLYHQGPLYQGSVRVPLLIKFPASTKTGRDQRLITLSDIFTTILSICDLPVPPGTSGTAFGSGTEPLVAELFDPDFGEHRAIYDGQYKCMVYEKDRPVELYDLAR
ncbi:sulfatase, partial [Thermodesulfobacteriota bacterium]